MEIKYIGSELELFKHAVNWKKYFSSKISSYIQGDVLEVGAGIGVNSNYMTNNKVTSWTFVEPDTVLFEDLKLNCKLETKCYFVNGIISDIKDHKLYDTIIYIDVLEHISDDSTEIKNVTKYLKNGGNLIILVPAYDFLYNEFDKSIGHFRRYDKEMLNLAINNELLSVRTFYLDSVGFFASLANKMFMKQSIPTLSQVKFWDRFLVNISKIMDLVFFKSFGKSLIGIYRKMN